MEAQYGLEAFLFQEIRKVAEGNNLVIIVGDFNYSDIKQSDRQCGGHEDMKRIPREGRKRFQKGENFSKRIKRSPGSIRAAAGVCVTSP